MANSNRPRVNYRTRLKRRRREVRRFIEQCEASNLAAQQRGEPATDYSREMKKLKETRK